MPLRRIVKAGARTLKKVKGTAKYEAKKAYMKAKPVVQKAYGKAKTTAHKAYGKAKPVAKKVKSHVKRQRVAYGAVLVVLLLVWVPEELVRKEKEAQEDDTDKSLRCEYLQ